MRIVLLGLMTIVLSGCTSSYFHVSSDVFNPKPIADKMLALDKSIPCNAAARKVSVDAQVETFSTDSGFVRKSYDYERNCY